MDVSPQSPVNQKPVIPTEKCRIERQSDRFKGNRKRRSDGLVSIKFTAQSTCRNARPLSEVAQRLSFERICLVEPFDFAVANAFCRSPNVITGIASVTLPASARAVFLDEKHTANRATFLWSRQKLLFPYLYHKVTLIPATHFCTLCQNIPISLPLPTVPKPDLLRVWPEKLISVVS